MSCWPSNKPVASAYQLENSGIDLVAATAVGVRELWADGPFFSGDLAELQKRQKPGPPTAQVVWMCALLRKSLAKAWRQQPPWLPCGSLVADCQIADDCCPSQVFVFAQVMVPHGIANFTMSTVGFLILSSKIGDRAPWQRDPNRGLKLRAQFFTPRFPREKPRPRCASAPHWPSTERQPPPGLRDKSLG